MLQFLNTNRKKKAVEMLEDSGSRLEQVFEGSVRGACDKNACQHEILVCLFLTHVKSVWSGFYSEQSSA